MTMLTWFLNYKYLLIFLVLSGCSGKVQEQEQGRLTVTDDLGRKVSIKKDAKRFLPFAPSVTEILALFCDSAEIVGRTQNCNYPASILTKPVVNNYPPDLEKILLLKPDLLITKDGMLSPAQAEAIEKMKVPVYFQRYDSVTSIFEGIETLASITGHTEKGKSIADSLRAIVKTKKNTAAKSNKKVLMLISKDSYFCFGKNTYASDILTYCGGINAVDSLFDNPYPILPAEYILKVDPDIILGAPSVGLEDDFFELHKELKRIKAFKHKQFYTIHEDYLSRPGPRVVEAIEVIEKIVQKSKTVR